VEPTLYVGAISGTSVDGLDLALLDVSDGIELCASSTATLSPALRESLLALGQPGGDSLDRLGEADQALGRAIGTAVKDFLYNQGVDPKAIAAVGSHGQTVRHRPTAAHPFTLQIGDPNQIVETTGITCVADFRRRDMAAGGQGAPLVPPFHAALFRSSDELRVVLNIGGISNITVLPPDATLPVTGFDTGPGNALMDAWNAQNIGTAFDAGGQWANQGKVDGALLSALSADPYLQQSPPKSTGREHYNLPWLAEHSQAAGVSAVDVQATLLEFTATTIEQAIDRWASPCQRLIVCGGGRHNRALMARLAALIPSAIFTTDDMGVNGDAVEAAAFAWLAWRTLKGMPGNEPGVTGAVGERVLGAVYPGSAH
tara:strand:+ start:3320 stop:4432 length:1113 start_codon:yes stop_codon:yes gene_type:complete